SDFSLLPCFYFSLFLTVTSSSAILSLSLHDALPILLALDLVGDRVADDARAELLLPEHLARLTVDGAEVAALGAVEHQAAVGDQDRKSTRLNSSHVKISYAVYCLKKKLRKQYLTDIK